MTHSNIDEKMQKGMIRAAIVLLNNSHTVPEIIDILCIVYHEQNSGQIALVVKDGIGVYHSLRQACTAVSRQELRVEYMTDVMTVMDLITLMANKHLRFITKEKLDMILVNERLKE